ncbi:MAG TPA: uridine kinase [Lacisediminihabitans sp.]|jgi:uridine kinase|nr:uridine kinase [Lacisediminihabitans sp.]HXD60719.1 uridine kinase [Lacisediminihabitans sp.]
MARWAPLKKDQIEALAKEILHNYGRGRAIVAIDGGSDAGTRDFADDLAATVRTLGHEAFRASIDDFQAPRSLRERSGRFSASARYQDGYDYSLLQRVLLDPFRATSGTGFVLAAFDAARDAPFPSKWTTAGPDALLIVDGVFLHRPELAGFWNYSVWLETPERPQPEVDSEERRRDVAADALYLAEVTPRGKAMAILDNSDPEHPRRIFADSC